MFRIKIKDIISYAQKHNLPIFRTINGLDFNLNIWGFRSDSKDTKTYNDSCAVFWENHRRQWNIEYFEITTDPSNLLLENPINGTGTAILKEGHHKAIWSLGYHKDRKDHRALVQTRPCTVYRDNDKNGLIGTNLPTETGMFGINMHRASGVHNNRLIGLYSAGCQVHYDVDMYNRVFIPLVQAAYNEGFTQFSYTLCLENWFK